MSTALDVALIGVVVLGGSALHLLMRSAWIASAMTACACMVAATIHFERAVASEGGAPMTGIAIFTIGVVSFVAASLMGVAVRRVRARLRAPRRR